MPAVYFRAVFLNAAYVVLNFEANHGSQMHQTDQCFVYFPG